ncbi:hypothetical protein K402DRAFT_342367 [Aulographum hederae CBS 113979]|uniref:Uncharacterized protein n=1 Tax=Aulographum hederae CBS 113979 TaxID=1176131 RepID=A0A6G1GKJ7_9PEZI|nr:hypothetical protein K402DRAFT_342367 [Aulographum hederae CBS 113979]
MPPQKLTFGQKVKNHFKRFWWAHLIFLIVSSLCIALPLAYVGFPNIAQSQLNDATLELTSQVITDPTPDAVHLEMTTISRSDSIFRPTLSAMNASLFLEDTLPDIIPFGQLEIPQLKSTHETEIIINQNLRILNQDQFLAYNRRVMSSEEYRVAIRATADLHLGGLPVAHPAFNKVVTSKGLNNLKGFEVLDFNLSLTAAPGQPNMFGMVYLPNPSPMTLTLGNLTQNLFVQGQPIGQAFIDNVVLHPGNNTIPMYSITDQAAVIVLLTSKFRDGVLPVDIVGESVVYNGQSLEYFAAPLRENPLFAKLDVGKALEKLGLPLGALTGTGPLPPPAAPSTGPAPSPGT